MSDKRYQIFVSSTFRDLTDERQAVLDSILHLRHIPAGMEIFPAANSTPWEMIRSVINDSDYYVLIIGGRYGSSDEDGISYTEREYKLALELGKPILPFLHASPEKLPFEKSESEKKTRRKLEAFRKSVVEKKHHCKYWSDIPTLKNEVVIGLTWAIQSQPAPGWVRATGFNDTELLRRLADLQHRFDQSQLEAQSLRERLGTLADLSAYAQGSEQTTVTFHFDRGGSPAKTDEKVERVIFTWDEIFFGIGMKLAVSAREYDLGKALSPVIFGAFAGTERFIKLTQLSRSADMYRENCIPTIESIQMIIKQFAALGLIEPHLVSRTMTDTYSRSRGTYSTIEDSWRWTARGREKYFSAEALRSESR